MAKGKLFKQKVYPLFIELHKKATIGLQIVEIKNALSLLKDMNKDLKEQ